MATRNILHRSKLDSFKSYLKSKGWIIQDTKGMYEVLRAVNPEVYLTLCLPHKYPRVYMYHLALHWR